MKYTLPLYGLIVQMSTKGKKLNPFQHVYQRPGMYLGSIITTSEEMWVLSADASTVEKRMINYNPGLFNIIREIVSNAIDNKWRSDKSGGLPMKKIEVSVDKTTGEISVWNDGYPIPVEKQEFEYEDYKTGEKTTSSMYPAEMYFGEMFAGTNFDDEEERKTSGINGLGAKICNIFSTSFTVDHADPTHRKKFLQVYSANGSKHTTPEVKSYPNKTGYTKITFTPEYEKFGYELDDDFIDFLRLYCCEAAMISSLPVTFNVLDDGDAIASSKHSFKSLSHFVKLFYPGNKNMQFTSADGDECVLVEMSESLDLDTNNVAHVSYINGIRTKDGGVHVNAWRDSVFGALVRGYNARKKKDLIKTTAKGLYPYFTLFVRVNMSAVLSFDSQTKDKLNSPTPSTSKPTPEEIAKILKWSFVSVHEERLKFFNDRKIEKSETTRQRVKLDKLEDANKAGTKEASKCALFITEGDSARTLAKQYARFLDGGPDYYGAFSIKGKFLNVATAKASAIAANEEVQQLQAALGLMPGTDYSTEASRKKLRYGKVIIFADADDDGEHIRGLLCNFFWVRYRALWDVGYITAESTPVVRVWKKSTDKKPSHVFYSVAEYTQWKETATGKERIEYLKGLASIDNRAAVDFASNRQTIEWTLGGDEEQYMRTAFHDDASDARKAWIVRDMDTSAYVEREYKYSGELALSLWLDTNFLAYMRRSIIRAIPSVIDGMKEVHRKMYFGTIKSGFTSLLKNKSIQVVAPMAMSASVYHHGQVSAENAILHMTQGFVGSNNIPLLNNYGQCGTRITGGKDAGAPRYTKTYAETIGSLIFPAVDNSILSYNEDDGETVEPHYYVPVIPMFLVNGLEGIATGFRTLVPQYNPLDLVDWIEAWLDDEESVDESAGADRLVPWWRGFTGEVEISGDKVITHGKVELVTEGRYKGWYHVTELPPGVWTKDFKSKLEDSSLGFKMVGKGDKKKKVPLTPLVKDIEDGPGGSNTVDIYVLLNKDCTPDINDKRSPFSLLRQSTTYSTIYGLDRNGYPRKYESAEEVLKYYCPIRLEFYAKRKAFLIADLERQLTRAINKYTFVTSVQDGTLDMHQDDDDLETAMEELGLDKLSSGDSEPSFDYLLSMQMRTVMSKKKTAELEQEEAKLKEKLDDVKSTTEKEMWRKELAEFKEEFPKWVDTRCEDIVLDDETKPKRKKK